MEETTNWKDVESERLLAYIEKSIKIVLESDALMPNNVDTWASVKSTIVSFLTEIWLNGGLQGATADVAFNVWVGPSLSTASGAEPNNYLAVDVKVAIERPAEYTVITFVQEQAG
ncbi:hypothetical protein GCM10008090_24780 [Arenicella chitinivorans]|uniref:Tail sheath protein C-terminal domain-containing protein n=1 Tax=Arenicella chitinivorans TaxID=1329800 RepID=A0A918VPR8_9GAMM|nr:phage tail sheath C-terminal domain-containing protein [Arenicella chitinivorans]GHA14043.1 hypothetical protein GCM10008090_24780 [Arenicella chitinivorans]